MEEQKEFNEEAPRNITDMEVVSLARVAGSPSFRRTNTQNIG
jgi:hypothetical protein